MLEIDELIHKAIHKDDDAFLKLMHIYKLDLYKTALLYLKNEGEALEAIQEVTYRAYKNIHKLRQPRFFKTWLLRIMINYCNDQFRWKKRFIANDEIIENQPTLENYAVFEIKDAMEQLDLRSREILTLKYFHDLKIKEIAIAMDRPEGTIKTWLHKALRSLREKLAEKGGDFHV